MQRVKDQRDVLAIEDATEERCCYLLRLHRGY